jgi:hypothetical protein
MVSQNFLNFFLISDSKPLRVVDLDTAYEYDSEEEKNE